VHTVVKANFNQRPLDTKSNLYVSIINKTKHFFVVLGVLVFVTKTSTTLTETPQYDHKKIVVFQHLN